MRFLRTLFACGIVVAVVAVSAPPPAAASSPGQRAVALVNKIRRQHGCRPLRLSGSLMRSSHRYAVWMLRHDYFGHLSRISVSRSFRFAGEALALHYGSAADPHWVVRAWMHSPGHRAILLSRRYAWAGISAVRGRMGSQRAVTWVAHVGRR